MKKILMICLVVSSCLLLNGCGAKKEEISNVDKFETKLKENNVTFEKLVVDEPREGLKEEYNYYLDDESMLKLYVFDTNSNLYKQAKKDNLIDEIGVEAKIAVTLNGNLGISFEGDSNYKVLIKEQFEKLNFK